MWREVTDPNELMKFPPETLIKFNKDGEPKEIGPYQSLYLPGDYPFLVGMWKLMHYDYYVWEEE